MIAGRLRWLAAGREAARRGSRWRCSTSQTGTLVAHRGGHQAPRVAALRSRRRRRSPRSTRAASTCSTPTAPTFAAAPAQREPHAQARADRSAPVQRHRQRLLRRDPASRAAVAACADVASSTTASVDAPARRRARRAHRVDRRGCAPRRPAASRRRSRRSARRWRCTGKFGQPCPVCGAPVQRIVYAENECNYCARCQTGGGILADRALSRLLHKSWPRSIDELGEWTSDAGIELSPRAPANVLA